MRSANGVGLFVIQSSHQPCRFPMLIEVVFVISAGTVGLALAAAAPMLGAAVVLGRAVGIAVCAGGGVDAGVAAAMELGLAGGPAPRRAGELARGQREGGA